MNSRTVPRTPIRPACRPQVITLEAIPSPPRTERFGRTETLPVGDFAVELCRRDDDAFGLVNVRRSHYPFVVRTMPLFRSTQKMLEESIDLLVRLRCWFMTIPVSHGNAVCVTQEPINCNGMIKGLPTLGGIFCSARDKERSWRHESM